MMRLALAVCPLILVSALAGCKGSSSKPAVVQQYEKASGNDISNDPGGTITIQWFNANLAVAKTISDECHENARTKTLEAGTAENAVCASATQATMLQHHYDNVK